MRRLVLVPILLLVLASPAGAEGDREISLRGVVVRANSELISVENVEGDTTVTCRVPSRLAAKVALLKAGDSAKIVCLRTPGRRAELTRLEGTAEKKPEPKPDPNVTDGKAMEVRASGAIAELAPLGIVVVDAETGTRLACRVAPEKAFKLVGLRVGDLVKLVCVRKGDATELAGIERRSSTPATGDKPSAPPEVKLYGKISSISRQSVTVTGERVLTCSVPAALAEKLARFAVGDYVKMMCRGTELSYLEKP